jgi:hypothetical protein
MKIGYETRSNPFSNSRTVCNSAISIKDIAEEDLPTCAANHTAQTSYRLLGKHLVSDGVHAHAKKVW